MEVKIVLGLQFGDEGKGAVVDNLCKDAENPIVIRFSGGQQCGHSVWHDEGVNHVHSSYGSGALRGVPTYIGLECTMYLNSIVHEGDALYAEIGELPLLIIHPMTNVTTPYDVAFNKLRETMKRHGSVGLGVGATMHRNKHTGYKLYAVDFMCKTLMMEKLDNIESHYYSRIAKEVEDPKELEKVSEEFRKLVSIEEKVFFEKIDTWSDYFSLGNFDQLNSFDTLIFEGSQGILLDMDHGVFPNVTYAYTTSRNALAIARMFSAQPQIYYVTRSYFTRHGAGWLPDGEEVQLVNNHMEKNTKCEWQGEFITRDIQPDLIQYAMAIDGIYSEGIPKNLVVTCMDQLEDFDLQGDLLDKIDEWSLKHVYTTSSHISKGLDQYR